MIQNVLLFVGGVGVLYFGAEWLVRGAARLAAKLGVRPMVLGLTVVSLGTSAPELFVSTVAALEGRGDLAIANVMGSNLANIGLILGISALVRPMAVAGRTVTREVPVMLLITLVLLPLLMDLEIARVEGVILLTALVAYLAFVMRTAREETAEVAEEFADFAQAALTPGGLMRDVGLVVLGTGGLVLGAKAIVTAATFIAETLGVSELVIGVTMVALGTSLPELVTSAVAAYRQEADIAVGNVIGSNVFNIAAILGVAATVAPLHVSERVLAVEYPAVLVMSLLLVPVMWTQRTIRRLEGAVLLAAYAGLGFWVLH